MPNTDPPQDCAGRRRVRARARASAPGCATCCPAGCITVGRAGEQLAPFAELAAAGVRLFTDDGNGVQDPLLMRRALEYSLGLGIVLAQHCEVGRAHRRRGHARGRCCSELGLPGLAVDGRGADGAPRHRAVPAHRRPDPPAAPVDGAAASSSCGRPRPTGCRSPPRPRRTTSASPTSALARLRPGVQGQPAAAHRRRHRGARAPGWPTARSTPSPPTTPRTRPSDKERPLDQAPPGMLGLETALGVCARRARHAARRRRRRAVVEAGGDRRRRRPPRRDRSRPASRPTSPCSIPTPTLGGRAGATGQPAAATRRTSAGRCAAGCATRCFGGAPVVIDGEAQHDE